MTKKQKVSQWRRRKWERHGGGGTTQKTQAPRADCLDK